MSYKIPDFGDLAKKAIAKGEQALPLSIERRSYQNEYSIILKWFAQQDGSWTADNVRLGGLIIYGWMPTILRAEGRNGKIGDVKFDAVAKILNRGAEGEIDFTFLNRSVVGTSKFLHFWRPHRFPIWDRRIREYILDKRQSLGLGNPIEIYQAYTHDMRVFAERENRTIREIEFALFLSAEPE